MAPFVSSLGLFPHEISVSEAADKVALMQLAWAYCRAVDRRDYRLLRSLYHDDAVDDHGAMFCGSADDYVAWLPQMLAGWEATSHSISNALFVVEGDHAEGELVTCAYHRSLPPDPRELIIHGRYLDQYQRREGIWRFSRRSLVLDRLEEKAAQDFSDLVAGLGVVLGRPDKQDSSYHLLQGFRQ
jgi:hypothetical protein